MPREKSAMLLHWDFRTTKARQHFDQVSGKVVLPNSCIMVVPWILGNVMTCWNNDVVGRSMDWFVAPSPKRLKDRREFWNVTTDLCSTSIIILTLESCSIIMLLHDQVSVGLCHEWPERLPESFCLWSRYDLGKQQSIRSASRSTIRNDPVSLAHWTDQSQSARGNFSGVVCSFFGSPVGYVSKHTSFFNQWFWML